MVNLNNDVLQKLWGSFASLMLIAVLFVSSGCETEKPLPVSPDDPVVITDGEEDLVAKYNLQTLGPIPYPVDNPPMQERIALGRLLFYDPILSGEMTVSCGTCHHPEFGFGDNRQLPVGVDGVGLGPNRVFNWNRVGDPIILTPRNAPTCYNTAFNFGQNGQPSSDGLMFWDGRVSSLEIQATKPITSRVEMRGDAYGMDDEHAALVSLDSVITRLRSIPEYVTRFRDAFPEEAALLEPDDPSIIDSSTYARSIAAFERELVTRYSPYDNFVRGDKNALNEVQKQGLELFFTKAKCGDCHNGPMFSDFRFVINGVPQIGPGKDVLPGDDAGREEFSKNSADRYKFRTPTLRNVELHPPYMHDGIFGSLREVVEFYNNGCNPRHPSITDDLMDPSVVQPLGLNDQEIDAIVEFMRALTDPGVALEEYMLTVPQTVPSGLTPVFGLNDGMGSGKILP
ncbi:MAG: cytochrome c peroxidase [Ignavibacteriaceae bacterium]